MTAQASATRSAPPPAKDVDTLRRLAARKMEIAADPLNRERRAAWYDLDGGAAHRPMILAEFCGVRDARPPLPDHALACTDPWCRGLEWGLRSELYQFEVLQDDHVVEPWHNLGWAVQTSDYGVQAVRHTADNDGHLGARSWEPALKDLDADFSRLRPRTWRVDRDATLRQKERLEQVFGDILPVRIRGGFWWTLGMTITAIDLIGLENLMLYMFDNPAGLHRLMAFLRDDHLAFARWLEAEGLLSLNNENDYTGSGSLGYTRDLPRPDRAAGAPVRLRDLWVLLESQETVGVGPDLFAEFIFPYQLSLAREFGKCYYGCCEPVHNRFHVLRNLPNLARISVSPWADQEAMAEACADRIVFSRKPNPTLISTPHFDEAAIRADLRQTLDVARGCRLEIVMKDVHTLQDQPERLPRWVALARAEAERKRG
jgi:hypothetical protein